MSSLSTRLAASRALRRTHGVVPGPPVSHGAPKKSGRALTRIESIALAAHCRDRPNRASRASVGGRCGSPGQKGSGESPQYGPSVADCTEGGLRSLAAGGRGDGLDTRGRQFLAPFRRLNRLWASCRLSRSSEPPRATGLTWSMCTDARLNGMAIGFPQMPQWPLSRKNSARNTLSRRSGSPLRGLDGGGAGGGAGVGRGGGGFGSGGGAGSGCSYLSPRQNHQMNSQVPATLSAACRSSRSG